jgi:hypothetical protein
MLSRVLLLAVALSLAPQEPARAAPPPPAYPPERARTLARAWLLEGDVAAEPVRKALASLSKPDAECRVVQGPLVCGARPKNHVLVVEAPRETDAKEVLKALKKGASAVRELAWTAFEAEDASGQGAFGLGMVDFVVGMSSDIGWYEPEGDSATFLTRPGKPGAKELARRFAKLVEPFGRPPLRGVAHDRFAWDVRAPDPKAFAAACAALRKLEGVTALDVEPPEAPGDPGPWREQRTLRFTVALEDLQVSRPLVPRAEQPQGLPGDAAPPAPVLSLRPRFDTAPLLDVLERAGLAAALPAQPK